MAFPIPKFETITIELYHNIMNNFPNYSNNLFIKYQSPNFYKNPDLFSCEYLTNDTKYADRTVLKHPSGELIIVYEFDKVISPAILTSTNRFISLDFIHNINSDICSAVDLSTLDAVLFSIYNNYYKNLSSYKYNAEGYPLSKAVKLLHLIDNSLQSYDYKKDLHKQIDKQYYHNAIEYSFFLHGILNIKYFVNKHFLELGNLL